MIAHSLNSVVALLAPPLLAQGANRSGLDKLDGPTRAKVLAALAALIILGFGLVVLTWMGARYTRRYMGSGRGRSIPSSGVRTDEWVRPSKEREFPDPPIIPPPPD